jgi:colanic acid/amylovoran biosynthesis protein
MKTKIKLGVAGINHLNGNRGVGALAISTIYLLDEIANENNLTLELYAISNQKGLFHVNIGNKKVPVHYIFSSSFGIKSILNLMKPKQLNSLLKYFKLDRVLCMGEGDSFSDIYGIQRFNSINDQHRFARLFGKKYTLLPQTIGPFKDKKIKKKAFKSINNAFSVLPRDRQSYLYVKENTKINNISEVIDIAFCMPYTKKEFSVNYINVGLNVSALLWNGGYTKNNQFGLKSNYTDLIDETIKYFLSIPNVKLHLVPHVVLLNNNVENDYQVTLELFDKYKNDNLILAPFFLDPIQAKSYIAGLDFFTGARMHSCIAAFSSGVPVFPMAYSRKFNGLFKDTLQYEWMGDCVNESNDEVFTNMKDAFKNRELLFNKIKFATEEIVKPRLILLKEKIKEIIIA